MRLAMIAGGIGAAGCLALFVALQLEKNAHADTRSALAEREAEMARYSTELANAAAERARAVSEAVEERDRELAQLRMRERDLRTAVDQLREVNRIRQEQSDERIEELLNENEDLRAWADTRVPDSWIDWLRGELGTDPANPSP